MELVGFGRCAEIWAISDDLVEKVYEPRFSAAQVDGFAEVTKSLCDAGLRAPRVHGRGTRDGREFVVLDRIHGATLWETIRREPHRLEDFGAALADLHLEVHHLQLDGLRSKLDQLEGHVRESPGPTNSTVAALQTIRNGRRLRQVLIHGDLHPANVMVESETGRLISIDWDAAMLGPAAFDVARTKYLVSSWALAPGTSPLIASHRIAVASAFVDRYREKVASTVGSVSDWYLPAVLARYAEGVTEEVPLLNSQLAVL